MSFKDKTFQQRFNDPMWNHSERKFETWADASDLRWKRFGLDKNDSAEFDDWAMSPFVRFAPDYAIQLGERTKPFLVEVQGTGKDRRHKFKLDKLDAIRQWNRHQDVWFWLWDDTNTTHAIISYNKLALLIAQGKASDDAFQDGKIIRPYKWLSPEQIAEHSDWVSRQEHYMETV